MRHVTVSPDILVIRFAYPAEFGFAFTTRHMIASLVFLNPPTTIFSRTLPTCLLNLLFARCFLHFSLAGNNAGVVFRACETIMPWDLVLDAGTEAALGASEYRVRISMQLPVLAARSNTPVELWIVGK